jgi:hypothetical protein
MSGCCRLLWPLLLMMRCTCTSSELTHSHCLETHTLTLHPHAAAYRRGAFCTIVIIIIIITTTTIAVITNTTPTIITTIIMIVHSRTHDDAMQAAPTTHRSTRCPQQRSVACGLMRLVAPQRSMHGLSCCAPLALMAGSVAIGLKQTSADSPRGMPRHSCVPVCLCVLTSGSGGRADGGGVGAG